MAQWVNRLRNNIFFNPLSLLLSCEISGALHLVQPGLMAGRLAGYFRNFQNWLWAEIFEFLLRLTNLHHHHNLTNALQRVFFG